MSKQAGKEASKQVSRQAPKQPSKVTAAPIPAPAAVQTPDIATVLKPLAIFNLQQSKRRRPSRRAIGVGGVITRALTAAGLMK
jgi:hypothetical protein